MAKFVLIRHAVNDSLGKFFAGRMHGIGLNEDGKRQAADLACVLAHLPISSIYSSPMERAKETAGPLADKLGLNAVVMDDFTEIDFGEWTGRPFSDLRKDKSFRRFNKFRSGAAIPGGETILEAQARVVRGLELLNDRHAEQTVAVVTHADPIKAALAYFAGIPLDLIRRLEIAPASASILELTKDDARILMMNYTTRPTDLL